MKNHKLIFIRVVIDKDLKSAKPITREIPNEVNAAVLIGSRIRATNTKEILECVYQSQTQQLEQKLQLVPLVNTAAIVDTVGKKGKKTNDVVVLGKANQTLPGANYRVARDDKSMQDEDEEEESAPVKESNNKNVPQLDVTSSLIQALKRGNAVNLVKILEVDNEQLIRKTCEAIPQWSCVPLLQELIKLYTSRAFSANSSGALVSWIQNLFTARATVFMQRKDFVDIAGPLYSILDAKLDSLDLLLDLSGRLDLVFSMSGISDKHDAQTTQRKKQTITYEEDNRDSMDIFLEKYRNREFEEDEEFEQLDEREQQQMEDQRDGSAYQDKRNWFETTTNPDEMSDDEIELEEALSKKEKELYGAEDEDDYEDDYEADPEDAAQIPSTEDDEGSDDEEFPDAEDGDDQEDDE
jgi:hypothetical protein